MLQLGIYIKPFLVIWAGLNLLDDVGWMIKLGRLVGASVAPILRQDEAPDTMCGLCDDVLSEFLKGKDGLQAVPCAWACLHIPACMTMCERMQTASETSTKFPCIAAGYCTDEDDGTNNKSDFSLADIECTRGPLFSCEPSKYCRRQRREGRAFWKFTCDLRPGMGRWVGIQKAASKHSTALAEAFIRPKHCGEANAGPYCISEPVGMGKISEWVSWSLSLLYGGYRSIVAIETPGGDDDQQWLTFWLILVLTILTERAVARVVLSRVPFYYEMKCMVIIWLLFWDGATIIYRRLVRKQWSTGGWLSYFATVRRRGHQEAAVEQLRCLQEIGGTVITNQLKKFQAELKQDPSKRCSLRLLQTTPVPSPAKKLPSTMTFMGGSSSQIQQRYDHSLNLSTSQRSNVMGSLSEGNELQEEEEEEGNKQIDETIPLGASIIDATTTRNEVDLFSWEYDYTESSKNRRGAIAANPAELLHLISKWILSSEGMHTLEEEFHSTTSNVQNQQQQHESSPPSSYNGTDIIALLLERAAAVMSFQPRYVNVHVIGTKDGPDGQLPPMDGSGNTTDCYIKCRLLCRRYRSNNSNNVPFVTQALSPQEDGPAVPTRRPLHDQNHRPYPERGIVTRTIYRSIQPIWKDDIEIPLQGGMVDTTGSYRNQQARSTILQVEAWDADVGVWGIALDTFQWLAILLLMVMILGYIGGYLDYLLLDANNNNNKSTIRHRIATAKAVMPWQKNIHRFGEWIGDGIMDSVCNVLDFVLLKKLHSHNNNIKNSTMLGSIASVSITATSSTTVSTTMTSIIEWLADIFFGNIDFIQRWGRWILLCPSIFITVGWIITYLKAVVWRSDDVLIGRCEVPIEILLDQQEHALFLTLQDPYNENTMLVRKKQLHQYRDQSLALASDNTGSYVPTDDKNNSYNLGVLRVKLSLSE
jgi:hypothetical protein